MKAGFREAFLSGESGPLAPLADGKVVILSDGRAGHEGQSFGLAAALGVEDPEVLSVREVAPKWLSPFLPVPMAYDLNPLEDLKDGVAIGVGWRVSRVMRWLKANRPRVFTVQLMRPSGGPDDYDVVSVPKHDAKGKWARVHEHIVMTSGMLNKVRGALLSREWERWKNRLSHCHEPRLAVLLGGDSKHGKVTPEMFEDLIDGALAWAARDGGSLLVTASRRTPDAVRKALKRKLQNQQTVPVYWWAPDEGERDNPYFAFLAGCEGAVVTVDSMAMLSEVATAGKPLYVWGVSPGSEGRLPAKFRRFLQLLKHQHRMANWEGRLSLRPPAQGLMDTVMVAGFVRARYGAWVDRMHAAQAKDTD